MNFIEIYKPTTQKNLFHKDIISHIRKWIVNLENSSDDFKKILFINGPTGCGKTTSVEILFKGFNLIKYDTNELKSSKKVEEIFATLLNINSKTLENIEKWNHKSKKDKQNIIFIDNIESSDIDTYDIIDYIHVKNNNNIPIIFVNNSQYAKNLTNESKSQNKNKNKNNNYTFITINQPSLLEMTKLGNEINIEQKLNLSKLEIKKIIDFSDYDIRQFLFILNQWSINQTNVNDLLESLQLKNRDIDMNIKLTDIFDIKQKFSFDHYYNICHSESITISNNIYQNYSKNLIGSNSSEEVLSSLSTISDSFSQSDQIQKKIFDDQHWELYDAFTVNSCIDPIYHIKSIHTNSINNELKNIIPYKDISYNFHNSLQEVKKICYDNFSNTYINNALDIYDNKYKYKILNHNCIITLFTISEMIIYHIKILINYFEKNKKGKNISKKEKLDLCNHIINYKNNEENNLNENEKSIDITDDIIDALEYITTFIINHRLFTIDTENVFIKVSKKSDNYILDCIDKIEIRLFKRFLNIFTLDSDNNLKAHVEVAIKYNILTILLKSFDSKEKTNSFIERNVDDMTVSLDTIWKF